MAVRIRLSRVGATKRPAYRVVAIEGRKPRDGRSLEILGFYDPLTDPATVKIETDRVRAWIGKGAQPSDTVVRLLRQVGLDAKGEASEEAAKPRARKTPAKATARPAPSARAKATAKAGSKVAAEEATGTAEAEAEPAAAPEASADGDSDGDGEASA
ncbi:MAG: 30S ribosomal protein S16 [Chloroflexi bacterium]|nr:MAG: 30S ribosomal protein S16 [Chloroflexota bacterium]